MIFLIDKMPTTYQVVVYDNIADLASRVEWQDIYEGKSIIIDESGYEYEWDVTQENEIGTLYNYTLVRTTRISVLISKCLEMVQSLGNRTEFYF